MTDLDVVYYKIEWRLYFNWIVKIETLFCIRKIRKKRDLYIYIYIRGENVWDKMINYILYIRVTVY